jgi:hypothetical protein
VPTRWPLIPDRRDDLPDDIAYTIAAVLCETPDLLESQYRHIPPNDSPVTYPLDPRKIAVNAYSLGCGSQHLLFRTWLRIGFEQAILVLTALPPRSRALPGEATVRT